MACTLKQNLKKASVVFLKKNCTCDLQNNLVICEQQSQILQMRD